MLDLAMTFRNRPGKRRADGTRAVTDGGACFARDGPLRHPPGNHFFAVKVSYWVPLT